MQLSLYNQFYKEFFIESDLIGQQLNEALEVLRDSERIFFIGNGGSNAICSHMMEDFFKIGRFPTFAFSDPALITCFANDYGYEHAMKEWLRLHFKPTDLLISISSSGESANILNATELALSLGGKVITLSGFKEGNRLSRQGNLNFYLPISNYGIVECFHQVILHALLDQYAANK